MLLIPAIDLKDGHCVRLKQGDMEDVTVFSEDPGAMARHWLEPGQFKEVVQIGAVKLDGRDLSVVDELDLLVKPRINARLSAYFENLTGIGNDAVAAHGLDFADAYDRFARECISSDTGSCRYGSLRARRRQLRHSRACAAAAPDAVPGTRPGDRVGRP